MLASNMFFRPFFTFDEVDGGFCSTEFHFPKKMSLMKEALDVMMGRVLDSP
jgi:hypothetical protein